jgi:hypothetical protein
MTRFYSGGLELHRDGSWQIKLQVHDDNYGDWGYKDYGSVDEGDDDQTLWFDSDVSGLSWQGTVDGPEIRIMYDWCENGVPDVQLVFDH